MNCRSKPAAAGAQRRPDGKFMVPRLSPGQQQVGEIRTRDQQDESHCDLQHPDRASGIATILVLQRLHLQDVAAISVSGAKTWLSAPTRSPQFSDERVEFRLRRLRRNPVSQSADEIQEVAAAILTIGRIQSEGQPDLRALVHEVAPGGMMPIISWRDAHSHRRSAPRSAALQTRSATTRATESRCAAAPGWLSWRGRRTADVGFPLANRRPCAGCIPSALSRCSSTDADRTRSGRSPAMRFTSPVVNAPTAEKDRLRSRNSMYSGGDTQNWRTRAKGTGSSGTSGDRAADSRVAAG